MAPIVQTRINEQERDGSRVNRFGRIYSPDARDLNHPMESALRSMTRAEIRRRTQAPRRGPTLNQIGPRCVKYGTATALSAAPLNFTTSTFASTSLVELGVDGYLDLYSWAQAHDEWPGSDYDGTSVRAGQEWLIKAGLSTRYVWARSWEELIDYLSRVGSAPAILGIDWTEGMDNPKLVKGNYYIEPTGAVLGGHAICCLWYDKVKDALKLQNTWGPSFGDDGVVYLPKAGAQVTIFMWNGEAVSFTETQ